MKNHQRDLIVTPDPATGEWRVVQNGRLGVRVEVWEVTQEVIDRDTWGGLLTEAGWYWQRMDFVDLHGPFADKDAALADYRVNRDKPGITRKDRVEEPAVPTSLKP